MLRFVICEDNKEFRDGISSVINKIMMSRTFEYKINSFEQYDEELEEIITDGQDQKIYILDVELPNVSGLEIASEIRRDDLESSIIFLTSHPECQMDVFYSRLLVIDYIIKNKMWLNRLETTIVYTIKTVNRRRVFVFEFNRNSYRLPITNILYIERLPGSQKCSIVMDNDKRYEIVSSIGDLKTRIGPCFYQTHKSCIVNVGNIKRVNYSKNTIIFKNDTKIYLLSNRHKKGLREYVSNSDYK